LFGAPLCAATFDFAALEQRLDNGPPPLFSTAYLVSSHPVDANYRPRDKHVQALIMLRDLIPKLPRILTELQANDGQTGLGIIEKHVAMAGPFLAGQILLDCTYCGIVPYTANDFLVVGPGAHWGLEILFGEKLSKASAKERCRFLYMSQSRYFDDLKRNSGKDWRSVRWDNKSYCGGDYLALHDIQNCLCEFRKYSRHKSGAKAKRRYFKTAC
jgi:hypothetical protein